MSIIIDTEIGNIYIVITLSLNIFLPSFLCISHESNSSFQTIIKIYIFYFLKEMDKFLWLLFDFNHRCGGQFQATSDSFTDPHINHVLSFSPLLRDPGSILSTRVTWKYLPWDNLQPLRQRFNEQRHQTCAFPLDYHEKHFGDHFLGWSHFEEENTLS